MPRFAGTHALASDLLTVRFVSVSLRLEDLPDRALLNKAAELAHHERLATTELIAALAAIDDRKLYLGEGFSSMFAYCTSVLQLSEHAAYDRIEAARLGRQFPLVLERLACGALTLTNLRLLGPYLRSETIEPLLDEAAHKSKHEVEALVARFRADTGLAPETYTIQLTVSAETREKLRRAQELLRHAVPDGDVGEIFDRALTLLLKEVEKRRVGLTRRPRERHRPAARSRYIPVHVRREVWKRDGGQCAFVGIRGRCNERGFLQFHHVQPHAARGEAVAENIQLRCWAHNQHEADLFFGDGTSPAISRQAAGNNPTGPGTSCDSGPLGAGPPPASVPQDRPRPGRRRRIKGP